MSYKVLARRYRPQSFNEVLGQSYTLTALSNALDRQALHHTYLFTGTRGSGKTTIARIFAKCLSCQKGITSTPCQTCEHCIEVEKGCFPDFYEVDAASRTKVEDTRELLESIPYAPVKGPFKIYLIDEVHMLSTHSFNALLKTLEEPPEYVKFLLATTDHHKLPPTVLSRCLQFHLLPLSQSEMVQHLINILKALKIDYELEGLELIAEAARGSMRDALSLLDQSIAYSDCIILAKDIRQMLGSVDHDLLYDILEALAKQDGHHLMSAIKALRDRRCDFAKTLSDFLSILHHISIYQVMPDSAMPGDAKKNRRFATLFSSKDVQLFYEIGIKGQKDLLASSSLFSAVSFEMTLLRMLAFYLPEEGEKVQGSPPPPVKAIKKSNPSEDQVNTPPSHIPQTKPSVPAVDLPWDELLLKLQLKGIPLALAQQCGFIRYEKSTYYLSVNKKQAPLIKERNIHRIEEALSAYYQKTIVVKITLTDAKDDINSPASLNDKKKKDREKQYYEALLQDPHVSYLTEHFNVSLKQSRIQLKEDKIRS